MTDRARIPAVVAALAAFGLAGCATPPAVAPTAADVRGLRPSGTVEITEVFLSGAGVGSGTLTFQGRRHPFTLVGELNGFGAVSGIEAAGAVYGLAEVGRFAGAYLQTTPPVSIGSVAGEIWLKNANGVILRLSGLQNGLTLGSGRTQIFVRLDG